MHFYNRCCNLVTGYSLFILLSLHQLECGFLKPHHLTEIRQKCFRKTLFTNNNAKLGVADIYHKIRPRCSVGSQK